jgi:hypothetical protein
VALTWTVDGAYGGGVKHFAGSVTDVRGEEFVSVTDKQGVRLDAYLPNFGVEKLDG